MLSTKLTTITKYAVLSAIGICMGGVGMFYFQKSNVRRSVSSVAPFKPQGLILGKHAAAMTVEIVGPQTYPNNNNEVVELVGYITQHLSSNGTLSYEWILPDDVELVRGPLSNNLINMVLGHPQQVSILVRGFSREYQKMISLKTQLPTSSGPLAGSSNVVSRPEDTRDIRVVKLQARVAAEKAKKSEKEKSSSE